MTALAQATRLRTRDRGFNSYDLTAGVTVFFGGLVGVVTAGTLDPWDGVTATDEFRGIASGSVSKNTGPDATAARPNLPFEGVDANKTGTYGEASFVTVDERGMTLEKYTVASSTQASVGEFVFSGTDNPNDDLTVTPTVAQAVGHCVRFWSGTTCDVQLFTPAEHLAL